MSLMISPKMFYLLKPSHQLSLKDREINLYLLKGGIKNFVNIFWKNHNFLQAIIYFLEKEYQVFCVL